jgi:hypothetical protein
VYAGARTRVNKETREASFIQNHRHRRTHAAGVLHTRTTYESAGKVPTEVLCLINTHAHAAPFHHEPGEWLRELYVESPSLHRKRASGRALEQYESLEHDIQTQIFTIELPLPIALRLLCRKRGVHTLTDLCIHKSTSLAATPYGSLNTPRSSKHLHAVVVGIANIHLPITH